MHTPDGPANTLPPTAICPQCQARVPVFCLPGDDRLRYEGHRATTGYRIGRLCTAGGEEVKDTQGG